MKPIHEGLGLSSIELFSGAFVAPYPPTPGTTAWVERWSRAQGITVPEFDLEIYANAGINLSAAELFGGVTQPQVLADDAVESVDTGADTLTLTGHAYLTGDGPVRFTGADLPGGLAVLTDYWLIYATANTIKVATSLENALAGTAINLTSAGTDGTIVDTADTERVHWHSHGFLGHDGDGIVTLTASRGYAVRARHRPRAVAYAVIATLDVSDPESISAQVSPVEER